MHKPLVVDNSHSRLNELLCRSDDRFRPLLADGEPADAPGPGHIDDPEFRQFLAGIFQFVFSGATSRLSYPVEDYTAFAERALHAVVARSTWPALPLTYFVAGAFFHHHPDREMRDATPDDMLAWYFGAFAGFGSNDRFVTAAQKRALLGGSEMPAVSLIVRLLWRAAEPGFSGAGEAAVRRWHDRERLALARVRYLRAVELEPRAPAAPPPAGAGATPGRDLAFSEIVYFGANGNAGKHQLAGTWNAGEADFCWGKGPVALFAFTLPEARGPAFVDVDLVVRKSVPGNSNRVALTVNGAKLFDGADLHEGHHRLVLPVPAPLRTGRYANVVGFHAPSYRPADHGANDTRNLGVAVQRLWIDEHI